MSLPPIKPEKSASGISVDPKTLNRVVAPSKRADGSVRKELKIRPGFTPQEDVSLFRSSRQQETTARGGKRVVPGWAPVEEPEVKKPSPKPKPKPVGAKPKAGASTSKKAGTSKKADKAPEVVVKDSWEDDDEAPSEPKKLDGEGVDALAKQIEKIDIAETSSS